MNEKKLAVLRILYIVMDILIDYVVIPIGFAIWWALAFDTFPASFKSMWIAVLIRISAEYVISTVAGVWYAEKHNRQK